MIEQLVYILIALIVLGIILWLVLYVVNTLPLPAPFPQVARVLVVVIGCIVLIYLLLSLIGGVPPIRRLG